MTDSPILRSEHVEFARRMEEEHARQNKRIDDIEEALRRLSSLTESVAKLASNMEMMCKEQEAQGKRLEALESRDGEMWRTAIAYLVTSAIGAVCGYFFTKF